MGRVLTWTLAFCWVLGVCFGLASPSSATTESPESSPSASPSEPSSSTGWEPEPTPEPESLGPSPSASESASPSPEPAPLQEPSSLSSESLAVECGTPESPCIVEQTSTEQAVLLAGLTLLLLVNTAALVSAWGSD